jgi:hypothetical protein
LLVLGRPDDEPEPPQAKQNTAVDSRATATISLDNFMRIASARLDVTLS